MLEGKVRARAGECEANEFVGTQVGGPRRGVLTHKLGSERVIRGNGQGGELLVEVAGRVQRVRLRHKLGFVFFALHLGPVDMPEEWVRLYLLSVPHAAQPGSVLAVQQLCNEGSGVGRQGRGQPDLALQNLVEELLPEMDSPLQLLKNNAHVNRSQRINPPQRDANAKVHRIEGATDRKSERAIDRKTERAKERKSERAFGGLPVWAVEGRYSHQHLVQQGAEAPPIGGAAVPRPGQNLRGQVFRRAAEGGGGGVVGNALFGQAKVGQLDVALSVQ